MRIWANHDAIRNWRTNLAFMIAGKDLYDWRSKHNRIIAKMSGSCATAVENERIIKLLEDDCECEFHDGYPPMICYPHRLIALIKGDN